MAKERKVTVDQSLTEKNHAALTLHELVSVLAQAGRQLEIRWVAGIVAGILVGGLLGRLVMRAAGFMAGPSNVGVHTANGFRVGEITLVGILGVIVFAGVLGGAVGGVLYGSVEPYVRRFSPWHGLVYGAGLFAAFGIVLFDPLNDDFARVGVAAVNVTMFALLFLAFGVTVAWLDEHLQAIVARGGTFGRAIRLVGWILVSLALLVVVAVFVGYGLPPLLTAVYLVALGVATIAQWRQWRPLIGYVALAVPVVIGTLRLVQVLPSVFAGYRVN